MGFSLDINIPAVTVFLQGLFSFFSPCVLPVLPLYLSYLTGQSKKSRAGGMINTIFFVIGISFAFFVLGFGVSALGLFFRGHQLMFARIGGILVILFGLYQLGAFGTSEALSREHRLPFRLNVMAMSPVTALLLGFTFSFAWTPCVGPALASVLLMAASASARAAGFFLIGVYTAGFVLPFLAVGLFTSTLLAFFKKHNRVVIYASKAGAVLMIFMGIFMVTGQMNTVTGYLSEISLADGQETAGEEDMPQGEGSAQEEVSDAGKASGAGETAGPQDADGETGEAVEPGSGNTAGGSGVPGAEGADGEQEEAGTSGESAQEANVLPAIDFTLQDQFGETHTLSEYKGKTVFLNFWATWCHWCVTEMDDIQKLYEEYQAAGDDSVVILGIAAPEYGQEGTEEEIAAFLEENGYTYPVVMDEGGNVFTSYGVYSYPTTFMIDKDGNVFGYAPGMLTEDMMRSIIEQTVTGIRQ